MWCHSDVRACPSAQVTDTEGFRTLLHSNWLTAWCKRSHCLCHYYVNHSENYQEMITLVYCSRNALELGEADTGGVVVQLCTLQNSGPGTKNIKGWRTMHRLLSRIPIITIYRTIYMTTLQNCSCRSAIFENKSWNVCLKSVVLKHLHVNLSRPKILFQRLPEAEIWVQRSGLEKIYIFKDLNKSSRFSKIAE